MARKASGGFNKFLNLIGLVDDVEPGYENEYASDNYGRPATYIPQRQRANQPRPAQNEPAPRRNAPAQPPRSNRSDRSYENRSYEGRSYSNDNRSYNYEGRAYGDESRSSRRSAAYSDNSAYNADAAPRMNRPRSRFEEDPQPEPPKAEMTVASRRAPRVSRPQRTVMTSLRGLEDCREVIDNLIRGNTIVLTMEELDGHLMQRAVDTLSGAVFALHATIRRASDKTYLIAPTGVEVNEDYDVDRRF